MMQFQPSRLQEACRDRRMRITDLADTTGLSRVTLSNLANGKIQNPQRETIIKLSWALKRPEKYFYSPIERNYVDTTVISYRSFSSRASLDNAVVMHDGAIVSKEGMRHKEEFARHKMMDMVGDLYLTGMRVRARISSVKSGAKLRNNPAHVSGTVSSISPCS